MKNRLILPLLLLLAACTQSPVASESTPTRAPEPAAKVPESSAPAPSAPVASTPAPSAPAPEAPASDAPASDGGSKSASVACSDPRPQVCTAIYDPVCATRDTGVRCITAPCPSEEKKTMSSACSACSDPKVYSYVKGECPAG